MGDDEERQKRRQSARWNNVSFTALRARYLTFLLLTKYHLLQTLEAERVAAWQDLGLVE